MCLCVCFNWISFLYQAIWTWMFCINMQDVFPVIPGDTDYRIFSQDYGNIPGLDIIFLFGGYFYHTSYDTIERLMYASDPLFWFRYLNDVLYYAALSLCLIYSYLSRPGSIQARGDNLFSIIKAFVNSPKLLNTHQTNSSEVTTNIYKDERAVFFDYLSWFMVCIICFWNVDIPSNMIFSNFSSCSVVPCILIMKIQISYSKRVACILHSIPIFIFFVMSFFLAHSRSHSWSAAFCDFMKGKCLLLVSLCIKCSHESFHT